MQKGLGFFRVMATACIAASVAFGQTQIGNSGTYWQLTGTAPNQTLTISGTGDMPNYSFNNWGPWYSQRASIASVVIEAGVTSIGSAAFSGFGALTSVTIPSSVTSIYTGRTFDGCSKLTAITVDEDNANYASVDGVLFDKAKTTIIMFPVGKTGAFTIPNSVESIGGSAFPSTGLTAITIPSSVASIADRTFDNFGALTSITVDEDNANYASSDGVLFNKAKTTLIRCPSRKTGAYTIPESVTAIEQFSFYGCTGLTSINIPNSVTAIEQFSFYGCTGLTSINIPYSVTSIGSSVFMNCGTISRQIINFNVTPLTISDDVFSGTSTATINLFVPAQSLSAYEAANVWKNLNVVKMPIKLDNASAELAFGGESKTLEAEFDEGYTDDKTITWGSSNPAVVTVSGGVITPVSIGTATITAMLGDGFGGVCVVEVVKANPQYTTPTDLTAKVGQTLADVSLAEYTGWSWMNTAELVGEAGERTHKAKFTPADIANYNVIEDIDVKVVVSAATTPPIDTPIKNIQKSDGRVGIRLTSGNIVSDKAEFEVVLPNDKVLEVKAVIYDNTGNVVFEKTQNSTKFVWNLTNGAGRSVANGSYLIVAEAKGAKGTYAYSAKVGVKM